MASNLNWEAKVTEEMVSAPIVVSPSTSLRDLALILRERHISGVPVVNDNDRAIGVVSQTDLVAHITYGGTLEDTVENIMTALALSLPEDTSVARAAAVMATEGVHRLPVLNSEGKVVGLLSSMDVVRWVAKNQGLLPSY
jgi:CBS domain-containing protein